jgi:hypothetical protein
MPIDLSIGCIRCDFVVKYPVGQQGRTKNISIVSAVALLEVKQTRDIIDSITKGAAGDFRFLAELRGGLKNLYS